VAWSVSRLIERLRERKGLWMLDIQKGKRRESRDGDNKSGDRDDVDDS
jgi:hypothetical protein